MIVSAKDASCVVNLKTTTRQLTMFADGLLWKTVAVASPIMSTLLRLLTCHDILVLAIAL